MAKELTVTHVNIRQSIIILLARLVLIDLIAAVLVIGIYYIMIQGGNVAQLAAKNLIVFLILFGFAGFIKIAIGIYVILAWLSEYYEISTQYITHKRGVIFKKTEMIDLDKVRVIDVQDSFLGELFNFATITLYEIRLSKSMDMYLIHNPHRYAKILKDLRPHLEIKKDRVSLPFMPNNEDVRGDAQD